MKAKIINSFKRSLSKLLTPTFSSPNLTLVALLVLGILGNYWHLSLFFGIDFLLGSIAVFIVIELYGIFWGVLAATIASSYTFLLWGHFYGAIVFICEALFVGLFGCRRRYSLLLLDGIYWLCVGMPLIFLFYKLGMQGNNSEVLPILFAQSVNGIFNVLVASLLLAYVPIFKKIGRRRLDREFSLKETLVRLLVAFVFFPSLILMILDSQSFVENNYKHLDSELTTLSSTIVRAIYLWHQPYENGIAKLSEIALESNLKPSAELQNTVDTLSETLPQIDSVFVLGKDGSKIETFFQRKGVSDGDKLENLTGCDREIQTATFAKILEISQPLLQNNNFLGCLQVRINLSSLSQFLEGDSVSIAGKGSESYLPVELSLVDASNKAVLTTREDLELNSQYHQMPHSKMLQLASVERQPFYSYKSKLKNPRYLPWSLIVELPSAPIANYLKDIYVSYLVALLLLGILTTCGAFLIITTLLEPIKMLAIATRELPEKLLKGAEFKTPPSLAVELKELVANFDFMAAYFQKNFTELNELNLQLTQEVSERKKEQNRFKELNATLENKVKERTSKLEVSVTQLKELIQNIKAGILVENEAGIITLVNQEFCQIFAIQSLPEVLIGKIRTDITKKTQQFFLNPDEFSARISEILQHKTIVIKEELQMRDGRTFERDYIPIAVSDKFYGSLWLYRDISDRKSVEIEIQTALAKETELNQLKSRLISMTSHEFRTPLTVISSSVGILKTFASKLSEDKKLEHLERIETYIKHTTKLLDEILLLNQAEAGKLNFKPKPIDVVSFCKNLVNEMQLSASDRNIIFSDRSSANTTEAVMDENLLRQTLTNLLSNAIKYSPDGGDVKFDLDMNEEKLIFQIRDSGIGIPPEDQKHLFESFHRATNVGTIQGTGLGLAIVKKCVELHGGDVTVKSAVGRGTTFIVTLPFVTPF